MSEKPEAYPFPAKVIASSCIGRSCRFVSHVVLVARGTCTVVQGISVANAVHMRSDRGARAERTRRTRGAHAERTRRTRGAIFFMRAECPSRLPYSCSLSGARRKRTEARLVSRSRLDSRREFGPASLRPGKFSIACCSSLSITQLIH